MSVRALIFHMSISCDKTFQLEPTFLILWHWSWSLTHLLKTWTLLTVYDIWTMSVRALIFHMSISCDKTFPLVPTFLILWHWSWSLTHLLKTLTLLITFEQWVLELKYFTWVFLMTTHFRVYQHFLPYNPDLGVWPTFWKHYLVNKFWTVCARVFILHLNIPIDKIWHLAYFKINWHWS